MRWTRLLLAAVVAAVLPLGFAAAPAESATSGYYLLSTDLNSYYCLTGQHNTTKSWVTVQPCSDPTNYVPYQLWDYPSAGTSGQIRLHNSAGECLTHTALASTFSRVYLYPCTWSQNKTYQIWKLAPQQDVGNGLEVGLIGKPAAPNGEFRLSVTDSGNIHDYAMYAATAPAPTQGRDFGQSWVFKRG